MAVFLFARMSHEARFDPYENNGGTTLCISGSNFAVVAADTRQSRDYSINTRFAPKAYKLTSRIVLACAGFHADGERLSNELAREIQSYRMAHDSEMSISAVAQTLQVILYQRRFFPYYSFCLLGGIDSEGKGAVYSFDPVGSYERERYRSAGSGSALVQPLLDSVVGLHNQSEESKRAAEPITAERAVAIAKDCFAAATERDIYTGDSVQVFLVTASGVSIEQFPLKRD